MSKRDEAWDRFFEATGVLSQIERTGYCIITADALKEHGHREPRLMAKIDTLAERPKSFAAHHLSLFPTRNGEYILFRDTTNKTYYQFGRELQEIPIQEYVSAVDLHAFDAFPGYQILNESQAIDFAYISSLLRHFTGDARLNLVIRGRNYSGAFHFLLPNSEHHVDVCGVQIEVDAGYESNAGIYLIEAKVGQRSDFNIRQLYYPYLEWKTRSRKRIVPIFLAFTNGKYYLTEFRFAESFGDLHVVRSECYVINENPRPALHLNQLLAETAGDLLPFEPSVPFPQADDLDKVIDTIRAVNEGVQTKESLATFFEFDERQGDYYANAAAYLGFLTRTREGFVISETGRNYLGLRSRRQRMEALVRQLLIRPTFRQVLERLQERRFDPSQIQRAEIAQVIQANTDLRKSTPTRRSQTVQSWVKWLHQNVDLQA